MTLYSELRRREVLKMVALYVAGSWVVLQVADSFFSGWCIPESSIRHVWIAVGGGLPLALVFSWYFDLSRAGVRRTLRENGQVTHRALIKTDMALLSVLSVLVIGIVGIQGQAVLATRNCDPVVVTAAPFEPPEKSVAVLPFANMSTDPEQEVFADGISEEILNRLAQIDALKVIARTTSFSFKGKGIDIASMAVQMNVRNILEGSVRRSGDRVRITAQLIDARDSSHLWSDTFDRDYSVENLIDIQSEIARAIAIRLEVILTGEDEERLAKRPTDKLDAYEAYLLGRERLRDRAVDKLAKAAEQFALAIRLDPDFAAAYAGLAVACRKYRSVSGGHVHPDCPPAESSRYAEDLMPLARKALELDDTVGEAWIAYASLLSLDGAHATSDVIKEVTNAYERGLELNPSFGDGYEQYARFLNSGERYAPPEGASLEEYDEATEKAWQDWQEGLARSVLRRGLEADPLSLYLHSLASNYPRWASTPEEAMYHARRMVEIAPDSPFAYRVLAVKSHVLEGRVDQAIKWLHKAAEIDPKDPGIPAALGARYIALGDFETALAYLALERQMLPPELQGFPLWLEPMAHLYSGRRDEAIALLEQMHDESVYVGYGRWRLKVLAGLDLESGDAEKALARYQKYQPECFNREDGVLKHAVCPMFGLTRVYQELGNDEWGREIFQEWWDSGGSVADRYWRPMVGGHSVTFIRTATLTLMNKPDEALDFLEEGVRQGWRGGAGFDTDFRFFAYYDTSVDAIRDDPRFQAAIAIIEADMAEQLENVREMERRGEIPSLDDLKASLKDARDLSAAEPAPPAR